MDCQVSLRGAGGLTRCRVPPPAPRRGQTFEAMRVLVVAGQDEESISPVSMTDALCRVGS